MSVELRHLLGEHIAISFVAVELPVEMHGIQLSLA